VKLLTVDILMKADARHVDYFFLHLTGANLTRLLFYGLREANFELRFVVERFEFRIWH
jgi:hypothetical protein